MAVNLQKEISQKLILAKINFLKALRSTFALHGIHQ